MTELLVGLVGGAGIVGGLVALYRVKAERRGLDISNTNAAYDLGYKLGQAERNKKQAQDAQEFAAAGIEYDQPQPTIISPELIKTYLESMGLNRYLQVSNDTIVVGLVDEDGVKTSILIHVRNGGSNIQINSFTIDVAAEAVTREILIGLLELNSENRLGQIGIQARDGKYRIWVDQNVPLIGMRPSLDTFKFIIVAVATVHMEVIRLLRTQNVEWTNPSL
jgi:hypothetical protein